MCAVTKAAKAFKLVSATKNNFQYHEHSQGMEEV